MSNSITLTQQHLSHPTLILSLHASLNNQPTSPQQQALAIVASMQHDPLFNQDPQDIEMLQAFQNMLEQAAPALEDDNQRENFSLLLCSILVELLLPKKDSSREFQEQIKALLSKTLPQGESVELFIKSYELGIKEKALLEQSQGISTSLLGEGNRINSEILRRFEKNKATLQAANSSRQITFIQNRQQVKASTTQALNGANRFAELIKKAANS